MKKLALLLASFALTFSITGCGGQNAGARVEDMPDEVKEYEARREAERGKAPTVKLGGAASKRVSAAAAGEPGAK
jgi:hypothetical protein